MKPLHILCLFDYAASTGFATVSQNIVPRIKEYFGTDNLILDICAINYFGDKYQEDKNTTVFSALKSMPIGKMPALKDDFGRYGFLNVLAMSNQVVAKDGTPPSEMGYDGIFIIQDPGIINSIVPDLEVIQQHNRKNRRKQFKSIVYFPIDHEVNNAAMFDRMDFFDEIVTYNEFCRGRILALRPSWKGKLRVMPHGINLDQFYPMLGSQIADFRNSYFGENADKFIILNVNRNQPRKDIPCTIFGFEAYKERNRDAFLYLHMNPKDPLGWDLRGVLAQTSLVEGQDFMFPPQNLENHGATIETLNGIYNACDVFLTTTLGEGWGLTVTEAMACRLPVICPLHTSLIDITDNGNRAYALENLYPICQVSDNTRRDQCDFLEVAEKLHDVHEDKRLNNHILGDKIEAALRYVKTLSWDVIAKQWADIMKKTF